ncbi:MAG: hypothetical protein LBV16_02245, partial [Elusimicrobiota bacterium]|nr:hypothetical protein [Elusimicrobiota bacterium]
MFQYIQSIFRDFMPRSLNIKLIKYADSRRYKLRNTLIDYLEKETENSPNLEKSQILNFLRNNPLSIIPYPFIYKYSFRNIKVLQDNDGYKYIFRNGKKLYFPKD